MWAESPCCALRAWGPRVPSLAWSCAREGLFCSMAHHLPSCPQPESYGSSSLLPTCLIHGKSHATGFLLPSRQDTARMRMKARNSVQASPQTQAQLPKKILVTETRPTVGGSQLPGCGEARFPLAVPDPETSPPRSGSAHRATLVTGRTASPSGTMVAWPPPWTATSFHCMAAGLPAPAMLPVLPLFLTVWGEKLQVVLEEGQQPQSKAWCCSCKICCWPASWGACGPFLPYNPQRSLSTWAGRQLLSPWALSKLLHGGCQLVLISINHVYYRNA